ncbi:MAG: hypothetical protein MUP19_06170 [Candidatus Aminicenantes bacterium]|nr:hypothetical protein [Candidatus Aminicenantes bacterium]
MGLTNDLKKSYRPALIIALAILGSLAVYIGLAMLLKASRPGHRPLLAGRTAYTLRLVFYGFSILQVIVIRLMRGAFFQQAPGLDGRSLGRRLMLISILSSVFSEVPALLGFILFLVAGFTWDMYALVFVSLVLVFMFFPRFRNWEEWAAEQQSLGPADSRP